ncbi:hypothetical protein L3Y34_005997 [Caenorhabditis briggsae]|uniref:Uncharacterized protein n=1 Tax=Caenorhabditis briggsae TaxID=6238 RepID=A0AAE9CYN2_CAEBR|nr:hypothetical protein L3Y34_005997 [Caenorhabditis briggsae]
MPVLHIHKSGVLFYVDSVLKFNPIIGELMSSLYCGSFALCISMLATHFIFRYVAVCKPHKLYHFDGNKIYQLFIPPTILFVIWTLSIYFNFGPNQVKKDFFRRVAWELYEEDIDKIAFMGPLYFTRMENGKRLFRFPDLFGAFISCTIMAICLTTCVVCAFKTYRKLNDLTIQMSERTRSLNKQLFWTLENWYKRCGGTTSRPVELKMAVSPYLRICQFSCFFIAIIANTVLLYLIKIRAGSSFGRYRIMMISFSLYAIIYATIEILTLPVMHLHGSGILFYVNSILKHHITAGVLMSTLYCGSFAFCISMLATHFIFRYIAVCRNNKLYYFEGNKVYLWLLPPAILFTIWGSSIFFNFGPNQLKRDYFRNVTMQLYDEDIDKVAFIAPLYYVHGEDGGRIFQFPDLFGAFLSCNIMSLCFTTCLVCAYKTYKKLNDFSTQMSKRTRALNKQLFWTLGLQTLLPCFTQTMTVPAYLHIVQYCAFVIAIIANSLLLHLIRMRAGLSFGRYRVLMISFSIYAIVQHHIHIFNGYKVYLLLIPPFVLFLIWAGAMFVCYRPNEVKRDFYRKVIADLYEEDIDQVAFIAPLYYTHQNDGSVLYRISDLVGCLLSCGILGACFTTCSICAYKTYNKLHDSSLQMSKRTRSLSKQLFWTLGLQTLLPFITQTMAVPVYLHIVQYCAFVIAIVSNCLLLHLIRMRAGASFGRYRVLMISFSIYAIVYANIEIFTLPTRQKDGSVLYRIPDLIGCLMSCGIMVQYAKPTIPDQFENSGPNKLESVSGSRLYLIFIPSLLVFVGWYINVLIGMADTYEKQNFLREPFLNNFSIDSYQIAFVVCMLWTIDQDGGKNWNLVDCVAALINVFIIGFCFIFILVCAKKIYKNSKEFKMFVSSKTKELNRQLFLCLILQSHQNNMMYQILHCIQFVSFIVSQFTNGLLLYLIWTKARKVLGAYSYLMATFSMYAIMYNYVDVITQPLVVIEKQIPKSLSYLEGRQFLLIFVPALFVSVTWFFFCYFGLDITPEKQEMLKGPFMDYYGEDSKTMSFVSGLFWSEDKNGMAHWNVKDCVGSLGLAGLMVNIFLLLFFVFYLND